MTVPSPPIINSVTASPDPAEPGDAVVVDVDWDGHPRKGVTYQWRYGTDDIAGARTAEFVTDTETDELNCLVRIDNGRGTAVAASNMVTVAAAVLMAPVNVTAPVIAGSELIGEELAVSSDGTWTDADTFTYQWLVNGEEVDGETEDTFDTTGLESGDEVVCRVTATNDAGSTDADSNTIILIEAVAGWTLPATLPFTLTDS